MALPSYDPANDFYVLLGVEEDFTPEQLKASYRRLARELHPDINPSPSVVNQFKLVGLAYEVLSDEDKRIEYDQLRLDYYVKLPPILRLSTHDIDFGTAKAGDKVERIVLIYNDGGDGFGENLECNMSANSGRFWSAEFQGLDDSDPSDAISKLIFSLNIDAAEVSDILTEEIKIHLESGLEVKTQKLFLRVEAKRFVKLAIPTFVPPAPHKYTPERTLGPAIRVLLAIILCTAYICGPFATIYYVVNGGHASSTLHSAWQGLVSLGCFAWLLSVFMAVPHIWVMCTDS